MTNESQAREDICRVGKSLFDRGYVQGAAGNISFKLDDGFLITPTDACMGFLDPAKLARLDINAQQISGDRASKTIALHARIYLATAPFNCAAGCVIHTHSTHCVALSLQTTTPELLSALTPYFVMKVGHVPVISYHRPGNPVAALEVANTITRYGERGLMPAEPAKPEETAKLACLQPNTTPLTDAQIEELRLTFGAIW